MSTKAIYPDHGRDRRIINRGVMWFKQTLGTTKAAREFDPWTDCGLSGPDPKPMMPWLNAKPMP